MREELEKVIEKRRSLEINDDFSLLELWQDEIRIITENMEKSINYILEDCSDEYLYWMSEVFEEVVQITQNRDFIEAVAERQKRITNNEYAKSVKRELEQSINYLD